MEKFKRFMPRFKVRRLRARRENTADPFQSRNRDTLTATGSDAPANGSKSPAPAPSVSVSSAPPKKKSEPRPAHVYEEEPHGLFVLHPPPEVAADAEGFQVE